jgi:osmoprotectant transport system substrate-binding protein
VLSLTTIADLEAHAGDLVLGGPPEWRDRPTGIPGLRDVYGLEFASFAPADSTQNASALAGGRIDAANIFTTDPSIIENDFVVLEDPEDLFAAQNVVPLINAAKATDEVQTVLDEVSADLDTDTLAELGKRVISDNEDASAVAESWLESR